MDTPAHAAGDPGNQRAAGPATGRSGRAERPADARTGTRGGVLRGIRARAVLAIVALVALAVVLVSTWVARRTAPEPPETPAVPTTVAGEPAWTLDLDGNVDAITAGAAGPVVAAGGEIRGLDPTDGSTQWTYSESDAELLELGHYGKIITGPDHRYAALARETPEQGLTQQEKDSALSGYRTQVTVLDTLTGRVAAERTVTNESEFNLRPVQLTDTAALIDNEAIDLAAGTTLWTLPGPVTSWLTSPPGYTGPAGHSTFVLSTDTSGWSESIVLAPQDNPDETTPLSRVATDLVIVDGWTIRYTADPDSTRSGSAAAINIDDVAAAGGTDTVQGIDLGQTTGPDSELSRTALVASGVSADDYFAVPRPVSVFDPATRTASPIEQSAAVDATTVDIGDGCDEHEDVCRLRLAAPDGSVSSTVGITQSEYRYLQESNRDATADRRLRGVTITAVPGAVLVMVSNSSRLHAIN